ncbi:hypothetical protein FRX31_002519 [Thalictrum thalictroides]|uniref:NAC domain-containing protein n=1 Tax=Thalictrum thalictroides TaxID=46969 RepID=A0A7J6XDR9_THATH|nr:hypothetical protein FRX31_002519 [Thalictrum thalictroides]
MKRKSKYSDKEIISFLQRKVNGEKIPEGLITEKNLYGEEEPWVFFKNSEEKELFFFTNTSNKFSKGDRKSRTAGADGFWKGDTCGTDIEDDQSNKKIGIRRTFTFLLKKSSILKTNSDYSLYRWTMHEYKLCIDELTEGDLALCRVRRNLKSETARKKSIKKEIKIEEEEDQDDGVNVVQSKKRISKKKSISELNNGCGVVGQNKSLKKKSGKRRRLLELEEDVGSMRVPQPLMLKAKLELIPEEVEHGLVMALAVPHEIVAADGTTRMAVVEEDMQDGDDDTVQHGIMPRKGAGVDSTIPQEEVITTTDGNNTVSVEDANMEDDDSQKEFDMLADLTKNLTAELKKLYFQKEEESLMPSLFFTNVVDTYSNWMTGCELMMIPSKRET